jgi:hypothetical protein
MGTKSGLLGILPMLLEDTKIKDLVKSGMLGIAPSLIAEDMSEQDRLEKIKALKEAEDSRQQAESGKGMKRGGKVSSASKRADGCATKGKTKGRFV